ncbi:hypothetical protein GCM10025785_02260 [Corynebacterium canis]
MSSVPAASCRRHKYNCRGVTPASRSDLHRHFEPSFHVFVTVMGKLPKVRIFNSKVRRRENACSSEFGKLMIRSIPA